MNLLSGLEKFGLDEMKTEDLFKEESRVKVADTTQTKEVAAPKEEDFLLLKSVRCPVCDTVFRTVMVKSGRAKRLESDSDLRPRFQYIDTNKYDVSACAKCGYTAINRYFSHLTPVQIRLIEEGVCKKFKTAPQQPQTEEIVALDYETAIERYKLALYNTLVKRGANSEKAYECLKIAWLYRGLQEHLAETAPDKKEEIEAAKKEESAYYAQAYEGFLKAMASENYPMCGMEQSTVDMLIANMAFRLEKYDVASRFVASLLSSRTAPRNVKDKALSLKEQIVEKIKK